MLLNVAKTPIVSMHKKMGNILKIYTTYKWIHNHYVLLMVVILFIKMLMKAIVINAPFVA